MKFSDMFTDHWRTVVDIQAVETNGSVERVWAYAREVTEQARPLTFDEIAEVRLAALAKIAEIVARDPVKGDEK